MRTACSPISRDVAVLAARSKLDEACVRPGRPLAFMLATPIETVKTPLDLPAMVAEEKLDGVRAQIHVAAGTVTIFARGLERVTGAFPEVAAAFEGHARELVLDGEILAVTADGRPRPFQALQMRLNRKKPTPSSPRTCRCRSSHSTCSSTAATCSSTGRGANAAPASRRSWRRSGRSRISR